MASRRWEEAKNWTGALVSIFGPVWRLNRVLGPVGAVLPFLVSGVVGFFSPDSAAFIFLAWLLMLTFWNVRTNEKRARARTGREVVLFGRLYDDGRAYLDALGTGHTFLKVARTEQEIDRAAELIKTSDDHCRHWQDESETAIRMLFGPQVARLFRAHPNVTLTESAPESLSPHARKLWEDMAYCLAWLAKRLAELEGRP